MRISPLILATFLVFTLAHCSSENKAAEASKKASEADRTDIILKLAHSSEQAGDFPSAEHYYKQAVEKSKEVEPRLELAGFYQRHHGDRFAMDAIASAEKLFPDNSDLLRVKANIYINMKKPEQAVETINKALTLNESDAFLYNTKGVALDMLGKYTEARNSYATALELDHDDAMVFNANLAMSYISTEYYTKAIALLLPLASAPDATPQIRQNLALAYGLKGDNDNALKWALKDVPEDQAKENVKFYNLLAKQGGVKTGQSLVPSKVDSIPPIP